MAEIADLPDARIRTRSHSQIIQTQHALKRLRSGGTAADVREALVDLIDGRVSVSTVRRYLWLLRDLGLADCEVVENARWWTACDP